MRDYKFRGFTVNEEKFNNGKDGWIYGNLSVLDDGTVDIQDINDENWFKAVNPESVGQYTGLKDKNGKEIYEGDIITGTDYPFIDEEKQNYVGIVVFYDDAASFGYEYQCVRKDKRGVSNGINNEFEANENLVCDDLEVIGNIYDNPELLGGNNGD